MKKHDKEINCVFLTAEVLLMRCTEMRADCWGALKGHKNLVIFKTSGVQENVVVSLIADG